MPSPVCAETSIIAVSPPHSSDRRFRADSCWRTFSGCASARSHLLIATTIGTSAARAWASASSVCGITPSSAATMRITMSVRRAPRARIAVNASWPGVSRNVILRPPWSSTLYAPMCCVMPPASPAATRVSRILSSSDVLPWSTWPRTATTGGRVSVASADSSAPVWSISSSSSSTLFSLWISTVRLNASASTMTVSSSRLVLGLAMMPCFMRCRSRMFVLTPICWLKSLSATGTVMPIVRPVKISSAFALSA